MTELQERRGPGHPPKLDSGIVEDVSPARVEQVLGKPSRKPFGAMEQKLAYEQRPNFHRHWFNDVGNRIIRAQEAGYKHVTDKEGKVVSKVVGTKEGGGALHGFLMEIPEEWYKEDMAAQAAEIDVKEQAIKRGELDVQSGDKRYVPSQGISIKRG